MEQNLSSLNLSVDDYNSLKSRGFAYVTEIKDEPVSNWKQLVSAPVTKTALDIYCEQIGSGTICIFNKDFDKLFQHETISGNIIEICGESGSGKTQICFQLCINVQLPKWIGGKEGGALYLCTNYNFSTERLKEISKNLINKLSSMTIPEERKSSLTNLNIDTILNNIHHMQINTCDEFLAMIVYLNAWLKNKVIRLLIVDSITSIIQQLDYTERRHFIYKSLNDLQSLAVEFDFLIVITNNMTIRSKSANSTIKTASLGESYYHRVNSRILLEKLPDVWFKATLEKSVINCKSSAIFQLLS